MGNGPGWKRAVHKAIGYVYVALWDRKYAGRRFLATKIVPIAIIVLSAVEIIGALFHLTPFAKLLTDTAEMIVSVALALVALFLVWHHGRQEKRIKKGEAILVALRTACVDKPRGDVDAEGRHARAVFDFMHDLLMKMVVALESRAHELTMHATILIQPDRNAPFLSLTKPLRGRSHMKKFL